MEQLQHLFDTHAHYDAPQFDGDRDELLSSLPGRGIFHIVNAGCDLASTRAAIQLSEKYPFISAAAGFHPEYAANVSGESDWDALKTLAQDPHIVAIGEIGLDYYYEDAAPREIQKEIFARQLELANSLNLPVIIHDRDAHGDTLALLQQYKPKGILHCFSGSAEFAREVLRLDMYIGFTGVLTFRNAKKAAAAVAVIPLERLLLETDCPYMAPVPNRGKRCDSSMVGDTAAAMAAIKGVSPQEMADAACLNACRIYGITPPEGLIST